MFHTKLGVMPSFSRPRVSNDNPFAESLFRTCKYRPNYLHKPFESVEQARTWAQQFVQWYNHQHKHSGLKFGTPEQRHGGHAQAILRHREQVYEAARQRYPRALVRRDAKPEIEGRSLAQPGAGRACEIATSCLR